MKLTAGQTLDDKYRITRVLGEGAMGIVYEGENTRIRRRVAIKVLHASAARREDIVRRFEHEAMAASQIGSEHIVQVLDLGNLPSTERYLVMEYLDGEPLSSRIKSRERLSASETAAILLQLLDALGGAHWAGIIHRDLKPENIFLTRRAGQDFVKLLDFGVSKFTNLAQQELSLTKTGTLMGTPFYMSPEQARGLRVDHRSDLYSVGVVAYQCLTGRVPFDAPTLNELLFKIALGTPEPLQLDEHGNVDPAFMAIVRQAMERDVERRYQTAGEFARAIAAWQASAAPLTCAGPFRAAPMTCNAALIESSAASEPSAFVRSRVDQSQVGGRGSSSRLFAVGAVLVGCAMAFGLIASRRLPVRAVPAAMALSTTVVEAAAESAPAEPSPLSHPSASTMNLKSAPSELTPFVSASSRTPMPRESQRGRQAGGAPVSSAPASATVLPATSAPARAIDGTL